MELKLQKSAATSLLTATLLTTFTMVLHPSGGSNNHIENIQHVLIFSHSIAILSLPFLFFGFYGLAKTINTPNHLSILALTITGFGLVAAMIAATLNGIALPLFISKNHSSDAATISLIKNYGFAISMPMANIFIVMISLSICLFSVAMLKKGKFANLLAYFGITLFIITVVLHLSGYQLTDLFAFRIFMAGLIIWILASGILMLNGKFNHEKKSII